MKNLILWYLFAIIFHLAFFFIFLRFSNNLILSLKHQISLLNQILLFFSKKNSRVSLTCPKTTQPKMRKWANKQVKENRITLKILGDKGVVLKDILNCPKKASKQEIDMVFEEKGLKDLITQIIDSAASIFPKVIHTFLPQMFLSPIYLLKKKGLQNI